MTIKTKKNPNKQKEVTAETFVRMAKDARGRAEVYQSELGTAWARIFEGIAEINEDEAKRLRGMR